MGSSAGEELHRECFVEREREREREWEWEK